jgi:hypothetical protein
MKHETRAFRYEINRGARALLALGSIIALVFVASACKNYQLDDAAAARAGTGSVTVRLSDGTGARLVVPNVPLAAPIARYDISCSRAGYESKTATDLTDASALTVNSLAEGDWTLTVDGCDASGKKLATGVTIVTIVAGKTATAAVVLSPIYPRTAGGQGTVSLVFKCTGFQAQSNKWHMEFTPAAGGSPVSYTYESMSVVTIDTDANTISVNATLDSGDWDMVFYLDPGNGDTFALVADVVKVYDGLTSGTATGAPIQISAADFYKTDRIRYVSNTTVPNRSGKTPAQACTLKEAIAAYNDRYDLTEADPGVIILTENVVHSPSSVTDALRIQKPMKIMSLASAATPYSISANQAMDTFLCVYSPLYEDVSLTLERVTVQPGGAWGEKYGLIQVNSGSAVAKLTLNAGATVTGNASGVTAGGVYLNGGTLVMNAGSEISGNTAEYGAGVRSMVATDEIFLNGGIIRANTATKAAGGISLSQAAVLHVASGSWSDTVKDNNATIALPDLARGYSGVSDLATINTALSALEPVYILMAAPNLNGPSNGIAIEISKPVAIIQEGETAFTLNRADKDNPLISILSGGMLTLSGYIVIDGMQATLDGSTPLISIDQNGTFIMAGSNASVQNAKLWGSNGSAIYVGGTFWLKNGGVQGTNFTNNDGTVYVASTGMMRMDAGLISGGQAFYGGGVYVGTGGKVYLYGGQINGNTATGSYGGGVYVDNGGELYLRNFNTSLNGTIGVNAPSMVYGGLAVASTGKVYFSDVEAPSSSSWISINGTNATSYTGFTDIITWGRYYFAP